MADAEDKRAFLKQQEGLNSDTTETDDTGYTTEMDDDATTYTTITVETKIDDDMLQEYPEEVVSVVLIGYFQSFNST